MADHKTYSITSYEEDGFTFVRVGDSIGWYCNHKGKRYGDFIKIDGDKSEETIHEAFRLLKDQAVDTIKSL